MVRALGYIGEQSAEAADSFLPMLACLNVDILMIGLPLQSCLKLLQRSTGQRLILSLPWLQSIRRELLQTSVPTRTQ